MSEDASARAINRENPASKEWRISAVGTTEIAQKDAGVMSRDPGSEEDRGPGLKERKANLRERQLGDQVAMFLCNRSMRAKCDMRSWQLRSSEQACVELRLHLAEQMSIIDELHSRVQIMAALGLKNLYQVTHVTASTTNTQSVRSKHLCGRFCKTMQRSCPARFTIHPL